MTPKERAEASAAAMGAGDQCGMWMGIELTQVDEGRAEMGLTVRKDHLNGHGICHGGVIFSLADSAFAYACNSRNQSTVAQNNSITYLRPGQLGDRLTAHAVEVALAGRSGVTDVTVTNQSGEIIATFRGTSRAIRGPVFSEEVSS